MEMRLNLQEVEDLEILKASLQKDFDNFLSLLPATQAALVKVRELYGQNAYVEMEEDSDPPSTVSCWIWIQILGGRKILGSGETWDQALEDAATKTAEPEE